MTAMEEQAFTGDVLVQVVQGTLRSRAEVEYPLLTSWGRLFIRRAEDIRWNAEEQVAEVRINGTNYEWLPMIHLGMREISRREHLHWRTPAGTVERWDQ